MLPVAVVAVAGIAGGSIEVALPPHDIVAAVDDSDVETTGDDVKGMADIHDGGRGEGGGAGGGGDGAAKENICGEAVRGMGTEV